MLHAASETALQEAVCGMFTRIGRYPLVWTGMVASGRLQFSMQEEESEGRNTQCGIAAWNAMKWPAEEVVLLNRVVSAPVSGKALKAVSPSLKNSGQAVGALTLYSEDPDAFGKNEIVVLDEVAVNLAYGIFALHTEALRREYAQKLEHQAHHDALAGLASLRLLSDRLRQAIVMAQRLERQTAVLLLDLDKFKTVNDPFAHAGGDMLLKEVANRLATSVRRTDTVACLGGDEFVVLLTNMRGQDAVHAIAEKIMAMFLEPIALGKIVVQASSSLGAALCPQDESSEQILMK